MNKCIQYVFILTFIVLSLSGCAAKADHTEDELLLMPDFLQEEIKESAKTDKKQKS